MTLRLVQSKILLIFTGTLVGTFLNPQFLTGTLVGTFLHHIRIVWRDNRIIGSIIRTFGYTTEHSVLLTEHSVAMYPKMGSYNTFCMVRENIKQFEILPKMQEGSGSATEGATDCRLEQPKIKKYIVTEGSACVEHPHYRHY